MANETSNRAYIVKQGDEFEICMPDLSSLMPRFVSEEEFAKFVEDWPGSRLIEMWNHLPGVVPVKKFTDRKTAVHRIWAELENPAPQSNHRLRSARSRLCRNARAANRTPY